MKEETEKQNKETKLTEKKTPNSEGQRARQLTGFNFLSFSVLKPKGVLTFPNK